MERDIRGIRRRLNKIVADHGPPLVAFDVWTGWWRAKRTVNEIAGGDEWNIKEEHFKQKFSNEGEIGKFLRPCL